MYSTDKLNEIIDDYLNMCKCRPTKKGLSLALGTSNTTIFNVIRGAYNGTPYGKEPHYNRVIDNKDFELIRDVFDE